MTRPMIVSEGLIEESVGPFRCRDKARRTTMAKATAAPKAPKKTVLTRARAEQLIARTSDLGELKDDKFSKHPNKHVKVKVEHKIARLSA